MKILIEDIENAPESTLDVDFCEIIDDLGLEDNVVKYTVSPMRITFANGAQIIFKGLDKPKKLKSINGVSIIWIEEASEISYAAYKEMLGRVRHPSLSLHFILSTNPIDKNNWVFQHFFVMPGIREDVFYAQRQFVVNNTFYHHSVADDNYFLPVNMPTSLFTAPTVNSHIAACEKASGLPSIRK